jgi:hypothetical protein
MWMWMWMLGLDIFHGLGLCSHMSSPNFTWHLSSTKEPIRSLSQATSKPRSRGLI